MNHLSNDINCLTLYCVGISSFFFPLTRDGQVHSIPSAIVCTPCLYFTQLKTFSFKPIFSVSSSTCFFQVFFDHPCFLLPLTSKSRATLKTLSSSFVSKCPYHLTLFAVVNPFIVFFNSSMTICSSVVLLSTTF